MQIGICSHKDVLCIDFLLDFTWKLAIHHPSRACSTSILRQQFLVHLPHRESGGLLGLECSLGEWGNCFLASCEVVLPLGEEGRA